MDVPAVALEGASAGARVQAPGRLELSAKKRSHRREAHTGEAAWTQATFRGVRQLREPSRQLSEVV